MVTRPTNIQTVNGMKKYIEKNPDEPPFSEELWEQALTETALRNKKIIDDNQKRIKQQPMVKVGNIYFELVNKKQYQELFNRTMEDLESVDGTDALLKEKLDVNTGEGNFIYSLITEYFDYVEDATDIDYLITRIKDYYGEYELNAGSDKFLVVSVISDELAIKEMQRKRLNGEDVTKALSDTRNSYLKSLDGLKALKKLDDNNNTNDNCFSAWVNKLTKEGKLVEDNTHFDKDDVDSLIKSQDRSIKNAIG